MFSGAKADGVYKGRAASIDAARAREPKARRMRPADIAKTLSIGRASGYRVLEANSSQALESWAGTPCVFLRNTVTISRVELGICQLVCGEDLMSKKAAGHHKKASEHLGHAVRHHEEAAKHHDAGHHETAAHHAHLASGHTILARGHSEDATKAHVEEHGKKESRAAWRR
jgi:hypothetical protein